MRHNEVAFRVEYPRETTLPTGDDKTPGTWIHLQELDVPGRVQEALDCSGVSDPSLDTTGSGASIRMATAWLSECLANHRHCSTVSRSPTLLPRRVLDLNSSDVPSGIRLVETLDQTGSYAAPSHRWGGGTPIKTTFQNISKHLRGIEQDSLPRTFTEAIHVTRRLGIQYLWIDSLCIIQNNANDWEREASMMHQYYKNSLVTIAAADGKNSSAGLFRNRDVLATRPCKLPIADQLGNRRSLYGFTPQMSFRRVQFNMPMLYMSNPLPLYTRCRVFQEQVLSPRILTYSRNGFSWRCQEMILDENPLSYSPSLTSYPRHRKHR